MNPFHFITYQAARDLDASLVDKGVADLPQRGKIQNRRIRPSRIPTLTLVAALLGYSGFHR